MSCRIEVVSWKPRAFIYHNFLSEAEAEHIKQLAAPTVNHTRAGICAGTPELAAFLASRGLTTASP